VRYFSDFLQARMQPQNQLILPSGPGCPEENFQFYTQGRMVYQQKKSDLCDEFEEMIRGQLEQSDRLQGF